MAKTRHLSNKPRATKKRSQKKRSQRKRARTGKKGGGPHTGIHHEPRQNSLTYNIATAVGQVVVDIGTPLAVGVVLYTVYMGAKDVIAYTGFVGGKSSGIKGGSTTVDFNVTGLMKFLEGKSPEEVEAFLEAGGDLAKSFTPEQFTDIIQKFKEDMTQEERKDLENLSKNLPEDVMIDLRSDIGEIMKQ